MQPEAPQANPLARAPSGVQDTGVDPDARYDSTAGGTRASGTTPVQPLTREQATPPGPHVALLLSDPAAPAMLEPRSREGGKAGGRSHPPLTGLSHPGDAEAGEAEEHDSDERDQQVHALGPHGAGRVGQRAARRVKATGSAHAHAAQGEHHGACAPGRAPPRTLRTVSPGPLHASPMGAACPGRTAEALLLCMWLGA